MRNIKVGDVVDIFYTDRCKMSDVTIEHIPEGNGDFWYFRDLDGSLYAQNPNSTNFDTIKKAKGGD